MSKQSSYDGPIVRIDPSERVSPESLAVPSSSGNVFTSFIKKVPYSQLSPALKRRSNSKREQSGAAPDHQPHDQNKRSAVSQIFHSVPDAVKKKFSRSGAPSPELNSWGSDETVGLEDPFQRRGHFRSVLDQIKSADTPLLRSTRTESIDASQITMISPYEPDNLLVESDDENTDPDGLFSSFFSQLTCVADVEREIIKVKSEIEVTQRNNTELTKKYLEISKTVSESLLPDLATREQYNQKNLKSQKHVRELQNKLKKLEERKKKIREQELMNNGYVNVEPGEQQEGLDRQKTPEQGGKKTGVIHGVYKKAVAKRRKTRQDDKNWGSDGAIDQSSGVVELAEAITETITSSSRDPQLSDGILDPSPASVEYSAVISDDEDPQLNPDECENASDRADSASNVSEHAQESIAKIKEDYVALLKEVEELRQVYREGLLQVSGNLEKQHDFFVEALQDTNLRIRQIDDRVDDKLDKFHYSSDERIKEIEDRLDDYKYKMTRFEELQEQRRMEHPLTGNDIASRGRDVMSSVISLGLAMVSLILFVFTTAVDCLKVFSENNALSTCLSLGLFGVIIASYYYFDVGENL